jgi:DNA-binding response OmpR family regulator
MRHKRGIRLALGSHYDLLLAHDGAQALELAAAHRIDVIVLDLMMPVVDGFAVLSQLAKTGSKVPVILASAMPGLERLGDGFPVVDRITKPYKLEAIEQRIERVLKSALNESQPELPVSAERVSVPPLGAEPAVTLDPEPPRAHADEPNAETAAAAAAASDGEQPKLNLL